MVLHTSLESRTPVVTACSRKARLCGVHPGLTVAEARTLVPNGWLTAHDPAADLDAFRRLAWQCQQFTPRSGLEPAESPESLFLDVTGCVHLFGDLHALGRKIISHFEQQGYVVRLACAATFGAAWGLARYGRRVEKIERTGSTVRKGEEGQSHSISSTLLAPLPLAALRLPAETLDLLEECGVRTIGQLLSLPRSTLPARFGKQVLLRLDQAFGVVEELLEPETPPEPVHGMARFEFPLTDIAGVLHVLQGLLENVLNKLARSRRLTQQLLINWKTEGGETGELAIRLLRPTVSQERLWDLVTLKLERLQLLGGVVELRLEAIPCGAETARKRTLFDSDESREAEFLNLIERLSSRLGEQAVLSHQPVPEYQPELACLSRSWVSRSQDLEVSNEDVTHFRLLPCRLLKSPVPVYVTCCPVTSFPHRFRWQNREYTVALCAGPSRISTGWWRACGARRDYYQVQAVQGARFWLFNAIDQGQWFLHGIFE